MNQRSYHVAGVVCLIAVIGLIGCGRKQALLSDPVKVSITVDTATRRTLCQERKILGTLEPYRETDVAPQGPGRVTSLPVNIGDYVEQGQVVARMDDAQLVGAAAQYQSVKAQYERYKSLYEASAVPRAQFEGIEAQYAAMSRQIENLQDNTTLRAPFAGIVTVRACEEGELFSPPMAAQPGQSRGLVHIVQLDPLKVDLELDDQTVQYVKPGMLVHLFVDQLADSAGVTGRVEWVNPQAGAMSRTFGVRLVVPNPKHILRPGYFADAHIVLDEKKGALSVPRSAIVENRVFVVHDGVALARKVTLGWLTDRFAEVTSGLDENCVVAIGGNKALPDSARVAVISESGFNNQ